ncbi:MAG: cobaltochelatase subunit CobT [Bdellovibrionales bacterium]
MNLELLKQATAAAVRALGGKHDVVVDYTAREPITSPLGVANPRLRLNTPLETEAKSTPLLNQWRGVADQMACELRHHDASIHTRNLPLAEPAAGIFSALEAARCAVLGAQQWPGVKANIAAQYATEFLPKHKFNAAQSAQLAFLQQAMPEIITNDVKPTGDYRTEAFQRLLDVIHDQKAFARASIETLQDLGFLAAEAEVQENNASNEEDNEKGEPSSEQPDDASKEAADKSETTDDGGDMQTQDAEPALTEAGQQEGEGTPQEAAAMPPSAAARDGIAIPYRVFTAEHDEVATAEDLADQNELARLRHLLDHQLEPHQGIVARLAARLARQLLAQQNRHWQFDVEEGLINSARLPRLVIDPTVRTIYKQEHDADFRDTVVTILLDNSGSMRGRPITLAALSADILARTLERCGVKVEILGFTTRSWKGGRAREAWVQAGKPKLPGRINELRHIIYKSADVPYRRARKNLGLMLREGLLKENIDGEALLWAAERLLSRREARKILMVISDGAPVDDATLAANPGMYLEQHLHAVIEWLQSRTPVELLAVGIGHDVTRYYQRAVTIADVDQLGPTMTKELAGLFKAA